MYHLSCGKIFGWVTFGREFSELGALPASVKLELPAFEVGVADSQKQVRLHTHYRGDATFPEAVVRVELVYVDERFVSHGRKPVVGCRHGADFVHLRELDPVVRKLGGHCDGGGALHEVVRHRRAFHDRHVVRGHSYREEPGLVYLHRACLLLAFPGKALEPYRHCLGGRSPCLYRDGLTAEVQVLRRHQFIVCPVPVVVGVHEGAVHSDGGRDIVVRRVGHHYSQFLRCGLGAAVEVRRVRLLHRAHIQVEGVREDMLHRVEAVAGGQAGNRRHNQNYIYIFHSPICI